MTMTLEQAIRTLHPDTPSDEVMVALDELGMDITNFMEADRNACVLACEVMQREVEREKGCCVCEGLVKGDFTTANYCFMCGRKLNDGKVDGDE